MKKRTTLTALAAVILLTAGTALAQPGGMHTGGAGGRGGMEQQGGGMVLQRFVMMLHRMDLTDEQMEQVSGIVEDARDEIEAIHGTDDREGIREQFRDLFTSSSVTVTQVEALLNDRLDDMREVNSIIAEAIVEIHGVLTAEQLQTIADFDPGEMEMHNSGHGEHAPMMPGGSGHSIHPPR